jgi:hypothetical protein
MTDEGLRALEAELRSAPPAGLRRLGDEQLQHIAAAIREARRRQAAELQAAGDHALRHIPRPLRGPIRKVLGRQ